MPHAAPIAGLRVARFPAGDVINAREEQGRVALQKALAAWDGKSPIRFTARVYTNTFNRNFWTVRPESMDAWAATGVGRNVLVNHDEDQVIGRITRSWADRSVASLPFPDEVVQELEIRTKAGLELLQAGGDPEFSARLLILPDTAVRCTLCGERVDTEASGCMHWRGVVYDEGIAAHEYSSGLWGETSLLGAAPATLGTGPYAITHTDDEQRLLTLHRQRLAKVGLSPSRSTQEPGESGRVMEDAMGEMLAARLNQQIDAEATEERSRETIVMQMATAAGVEAGIVTEDLTAVNQCPPMERLDAYTTVLSVSAEELVASAGEDGCSYGAVEEEETPAPPVPPADIPGPTTAKAQRELIAHSRQVEAENRDLKARVERLERAVNASERARVRDESKLKVREARAQGKVVGDEAELVSLRVENPGLFDRIVSHTKPNQAYAQGRRSGAPTFEPDGEEPASFTDLYERADELAQETSKRTGRAYQECFEEHWKTLRNAMAERQTAAARGGRR